MEPICFHRASAPPLDTSPGHIASRDDLPETLHPASRGLLWPMLCVRAIHLTCQSPFYGTPGHIGSRDDLPETLYPAFRGLLWPVLCVRAIHLTCQSPFYGTPGHIDSRDGIGLFPLSVGTPSRDASKAHCLA